MSSLRVSPSPQTHLECLEVSILSRSRDGPFCLLSKGDEVVLRVQPLALGNAMMITESPVTLLLGEQGPPRPVDSFVAVECISQSMKFHEKEQLTSSFMIGSWVLFKYMGRKLKLQFFNLFSHLPLYVGEWGIENNKLHYLEI